MIDFLEIEGSPNTQILRGILGVYQTIFGTEKIEKIQTRLAEKQDLYIVLALDNQQVIGFKIGYRISETIFYSWLGGVLESHRGQSIAAELMRRQHTWCAEKGYEQIQTKTLNRWRSMLILNLKMGFEIIGTYRDEHGILKIILEKKIV